MKTENKLKITPGPWEQDKQYTKDFQEFFRVCDRHGVPIVKTPNINPNSEFGQHQEEDLANARAIAAVPELIAAAQNAIRSLSPIEDLSQLDPNLDADSAILDLIAVLNKINGVNS